MGNAEPMPEMGPGAGETSGFRLSNGPGRVNGAGWGRVGWPAWLIRMLGLDQLATVYVRGPDDTFNVVHRDNLPVRLSSVGEEGTASERAELAATRNMMYGPGYTLPEESEIEVENERWTIVRGTQSRWRGPDGRVYYQRVNLVRSDG